MTDILTRLTALTQRTENDPDKGFYKSACNALADEYDKAGLSAEADCIRLGMPGRLTSRRACRSEESRWSQTSAQSALSVRMRSTPRVATTHRNTVTLRSSERVSTCGIMLPPPAP